MANIFDKVFKKNNQSKIKNYRLYDIDTPNNNNKLDSHNNLNILSNSEHKLLKDVYNTLANHVRPAIPRINNERQATGPAIPVRNESLVNITDGVNLSNTADQFGTFNRNQSSNQNQGQSSQSNNAEPSTSRANRTSENSYFSDTQSISQRASISSDTFGRNNRNSTYTDISNGSSSQTSNSTLQRVNSINSNVSATPRRSPRLGG